MVQHAAPWIAQESTTFTSGSLSSRPRPSTAMRSAVEARALELVPRGASTPSPLGLTDTPLLHMADGSERDSIMKNRVAILPGKRVGIAEEVVPVILLLVINDCMMGEVVHVDGAAASCHKARSIPYTIEGQTLSLPQQATHTYQPCRPAEVTFHWPGA